MKNYEPQYFLKNKVPYEQYGTFVNGDVSGYVIGSMNDYWQLQRLGIIRGGRFKRDEIIFVSKDDADNALKEILSK